MSDLAKSFKGLKPKLKAEPKGGRVEKMVHRITDEDPAAGREFLRALKDPERVSADALSDLLAANGYVLGRASIRSWRLVNLPKE